MSLTILQFVVTAAVIVIAGTYLTRYADAIAESKQAVGQADRVAIL